MAKEEFLCKTAQPYTIHRPQICSLVKYDKLFAKLYISEYGKVAYCLFHNDNLAGCNIDSIFDSVRQLMIIFEAIFLNWIINLFIETKPKSISVSTKTFKLSTMYESRDFSQTQRLDCEFKHVCYAKPVLSFICLRCVTHFFNQILIILLVFSKNQFENVKLNLTV